MALYTFITGSMASTMTDMVKHLLRTGLEKLATEGKLVGTVDEAMDLLDAVEVKEPVLEQAHLWWTGEVIEDNCKAICRAEGRMLQCPFKASGGDYCKKCTRQISTKGKLSLGTVQDRLACDPADYPGVKPYDIYAKRHNITDEQITQAEEVYESKCPRMDKKRGRPQKTKRASAVEELTINEEAVPPPKLAEVLETEVVTKTSEPLEDNPEKSEADSDGEKEKKEADSDEVPGKKPRAKKEKKEKSEADSDEVPGKKPRAKKEKKEKSDADSDGEKEKKPRKKKEKEEVKPVIEVPVHTSKESQAPPAEDSGDELEVEEWTHPVNGTKYCIAPGNVLYTEDGDRVGVWHAETQEIVV